MATRSFLILHGIENHRPPKHWQHWLADRLRWRNEHVLYPGLPEPDTPELADWEAALDRLLEEMGEERIVVCHSLACLLWLAHAPALAAPVDRVLLVAPPASDCLPPAGASFRIDGPGGWDSLAVRASSREAVRIACGDDDPYNPVGAPALYAEAIWADVDVTAATWRSTMATARGPQSRSGAWTRRRASTPAARRNRSRAARATPSSRGLSATRAVAPRARGVSESRRRARAARASRAVAREAAVLDVEDLDQAHSQAFQQAAVVDVVGGPLTERGPQGLGLGGGDRERAGHANRDNTQMAPPTFFYDFSSPYAYVAAHRVDDVLPERPRWQPIAFAFLLRAVGKTPWSFEHGPARDAGMRECERRAEALGLPPLVWREEWPMDYSIAAVRAALVAAEEDRLREYSKAMFAQRFVLGADTREAGVLAAAFEEAGLDPAEVARRVETDEVKARLKQVTDDAVARGVTGIPTVAVGDQLFWGDDRLDAAAAALV